MADIIVGLIIIAIFTASILKIVSEKKKGVKCVGCPYAGNTSKKQCGCNH